MSPFSLSYICVDNMWIQGRELFTIEVGDTVLPEYK